jgi:WD40 repeat protein
VLIASNDFNIYLWDMSTKQLMRTMSGHMGEVRDLVFLSNGNIASCSNDLTIRIWNQLSGELICTMTGHTNWITTVSVASNGMLVSGSLDSTVKFWNTTSCQLVSTVNVSDSVNVLATNSSSNNFLVGCNFSTFTVSSSSFVSVQNSTTQYLGLYSILFLGFVQVRGFGNGTITTYMPSNSYPNVAMKHTDRVSCLQAINSYQFASGSFDMSIILWNVDSTNASLTMVTTFTGHSNRINTLSLLYNGLLVSGSDDGKC